MIVYYHGSGWVVLNIEICDATLRALANDTGCVVVAVNYQKAPEHKFPVPFNDAGPRSMWRGEHAEELGVDPARIAVGGDSAGGNLAAAVAIKARDAGGPRDRLPAADLPGRRPRLDTPSLPENAEGYLLQRESMRWFWDHYLGPGATRRLTRSPLRAPTSPACRPRSSSPPSSTRCATTAAPTPTAARGRRQGHLHNYDGMIHGFYWMQAAFVDRARDLHADIAREVRAACTGADEIDVRVVSRRAKPPSRRSRGRVSPNGRGITARPGILAA